LGTTAHPVCRGSGMVFVSEAVAKPTHALQRKMPLSVLTFRVWEEDAGTIARTLDLLLLRLEFRMTKEAKARNNNTKE
jgi:hypothetical protein